MSHRLLFALSTSALILSGCASGSFKARQEQREKMAASTGMFCEFLSGDVYHDLDVELSMKMANRCDANRNFSITNYKNTSDQNGVIYCCATSGRGERKAAAPKKAPVTPSKQEAEQSDAEVISE
ncbi:hypothetical protein [Bdellovibrio bacteriovorus]|uniref:Lipoprotein n=1 Tax=Bdellovibrio bacteriovorus str. Tiberius TaxID=1069642 RepID=K7ZC13_BDEBC|nr:hypothetical protein [Bdellovibrio bacteriovorus]AFY02804.1 hypothetical protein Bdt_3129 [Bdellovibrio bacteriovorus str. Tiberius]